MQRHFSTTCRWTGSTLLGYDHYDRSHIATSEPASVSLDMSADPGFGGDPARLNPEQLLVTATASCQLLSFLALAARARVHVVEYVDRAEGQVTSDAGAIAMTAITLRPEIVVRGPVEEAKILRLVELAHKECYIANSLRTEITIEPSIHSETT